MGRAVIARGPRARRPRAVIHGQLAPFTFSRNEEQAMLLELFRDFSMAQAARGKIVAGC